MHVRGINHVVTLDLDDLGDLGDLPQGHVWIRGVRVRRWEIKTFRDTFSLNSQTSSIVACSSEELLGDERNAVYTMTAES